MGFLADAVKANERGGNPRRAWDGFFGGATDKERGFGRPQPPSKEARREPDFGGNSSNRNAQRKLLEAMRSSAPGGWSDDRWEQSKHFVGIQYLAIHRKGELLAQAEFQVFKKDRTAPDGKRPVTPEDPEEGDRLCKPYDLVKLLEKPNPDDSFGDLMYRWGQQVDLTGKALTWMVPNKLGTPMELYPIPTALAIPQTVINEEYPKGYYRIQPLYPYGPFSSYPTPNASIGAPIPSQWMLDFKYPHPLLRYDGYAPLTALRLHIDEVESMDRSRWYSMKRSINPSAVLNMDDVEGAEPLPEPEINRIHAEWENEFQGPENHGRLIVGTPGGKFEIFGNTPIEMDYQAGWEQLVNFVLGGFGITKPAAGMVDDTSYSTLFATLKQLYWITLEPMCARIAAHLTRKLAPFFGDDLIVEIRCKRIDDHEITFQKADKLVGLQGLPEKVIKYVMRMLDLPIDEEMVQQLSTVGQQMMGMEQGGMQPGMEAGMVQDGEGAPQGDDLAGFEAMIQELETEDQEIESQRPDAGTLNEGSLGPRMKSFNRVGKRLDLLKSMRLGRFRLADRVQNKMLETPAEPRKSIYELVNEVIGNGH